MARVIFAVTVSVAVATAVACSQGGSSAVAACDDSPCELDPKRTPEERAACEAQFQRQACGPEFEAFAACENSNRVCAPEKKTDEVRTGQAVEENCGVQSYRFARCLVRSLDNPDAGDGG